MPEPIEEPARGLRLGPREDHEAQARRVDAAAARVAGDLQRAADAADGETRDVLEATAAMAADPTLRSEEHTSELQSRENLVCRLLLEKKNRSVRREMS